DDARSLFAVTSFLESQGAKVIAAESGREGIDVLNKSSGIDLVLMDIMMPEMDGYQATQEIKKMDRFKSLPIIALTAKAMPEDQASAKKAGCADFVSKPVDKEQLLKVILKQIPGRVSKAS